MLLTDEESLAFLAARMPGEDPDRMRALATAAQGWIAAMTAALATAAGPWRGDPAGWLDEPRAAGVPAAMGWAPVITFLQAFVDMLNGSHVTYGTFAALGHDYRHDLLDSVPALFELPATAVQRERLAAALPAFERDFVVGMGSLAKAQPWSDGSSASAPCRRGVDRCVRRRILRASRRSAP